MSAFDDALASLSQVEVPDLDGGHHENPFAKVDDVVTWNSREAEPLHTAIVDEAVELFGPAVLEFKTIFFKTYTKNEKWLWEKMNPKPQHYACMVDVLLMFFSIFTRIGVGYIDEDVWIPTPLYRYHTYPGQTPEIRSNGHFCFVSPDNSSVYIELKTITIADCINSFFRLIDKLDFYKKSSPFYIAPPGSEPTLMPLFTKALCSFPYTPKFKEYGMLEIPTQSWQTFAIGPYNIDCPNPVRKWNDIPQILRLEPTEPPVNDVDRFYPLVPDQLEKFDECLDLCNKLLYNHATVTSLGPKHEARRWYCKLVAALIHKYCPHLTCLIGTQVMQRIAREHVTDVEPDDPRPAPYVPDYLEHINDDELEAFTDSIYGLASVLFSYTTGILALVGAAGCGKTTLTDMMCMLIGGMKRVTILDEFNGPFSSSMFNMCDGPGLILVEDSENSPATLPKSVMGNFTGTRRLNTHNTYVPRQKHVPEVPARVIPKGALFTCNFPPVTDEEGSDIARIIRAIIKGAGDGYLRRVHVSPPGTSPTAGGTCGSTPFEFDIDALLEREHIECEGAFMIVLFAAIGLVGNDLYHPEHGFCSPSNELVNTLFEDWIARSKNPAGHCTAVARNLVMPAVPTFFGTPAGTLRMMQGLTLPKLTDAYFQKTRSVLSHAPHSPEFFRALCYNCKHCHMVYSGADVSVAGINAFYNSCSQVNRDYIKRQCPENPQARCYQSLEHTSIYSSWQLRPDN